jgi:hypothetical protein
VKAISTKSIENIEPFSVEQICNTYFLNEKLETRNKNMFINTFKYVRLKVLLSALNWFKSAKKIDTFITNISKPLNPIKFEFDNIKLQIVKLFIIDICNTNNIISQISNILELEKSQV